MSNMIRKSMDPEGEHDSPLGEGRIDPAYANIQVRVLHWPEEERFKQLVYKATMATRGSDIASDNYEEDVVAEAFSGGLNQCLEWVTVVFEIDGVTRGLTHELVRTRKASFAQQSMRHTNMGQPNVRIPENVVYYGTPGQNQLVPYVWQSAIEKATDAYEMLVDWDVPYQDARTVLPIATETYIIGAYPLSVFLGTYAYRACYMFYPEIVVLFRMMREALLEKCPWLKPYIVVSCEKTRPNEDHEHMCTYQGWERVEGHCPLAWAKEDNRVWKSSKFEN